MLNLATIIRHIIKRAINCRHNRPVSGRCTAVEQNRDGESRLPHDGMASNELGQFQFGRLEAGTNCKVAGANGSPHQEVRPPGTVLVPLKLLRKRFAFLRTLSDGAQ